MIKQIFTADLIARKSLLDEYGITSVQAFQDVHAAKADIAEQARQLFYGTLEDVLCLYTQLPMKGRLQYGSYNMVPYRSQLDKIVEEILQTGDIKGTYKEFLGIW